MSVKETALNFLAIVSLSTDRCWCPNCPNQKKHLGRCVPDIEKVVCLDCIENRKNVLREKKVKSVEEVESLNENP